MTTNSNRDPQPLATNEQLSSWLAALYEAIEGAVKSRDTLEMIRAELVGVVRGFPGLGMRYAQYQEASETSRRALIESARKKLTADEFAAVRKA